MLQEEVFMLQESVIFATFYPWCQLVFKLSQLKKIQGRLNIQERLNILGKAKDSISVTPFQEKLDNVIEKNPDLKKMAYFKDILDGKQPTDPIDQLDELKFKNSPFVGRSGKSIF